MQMKDYSKQQLVDCLNFSAVGVGTNGGRTAQIYTLLTGRGPVVKVAVLFGSDTIADLAALQITVSYNGSEALSNANGMLFRTTQYGTQKEFKVLQWQEGSKINVNVANSGANAVPCSVFFYYTDQELADLKEAVENAGSIQKLVLDYVPSVNT